MAAKKMCLQKRDMDALLKIMDCIIPADDFPSASEAGVDRFLLELWDSGTELSASLVYQGLSKLNLQAQTEFGVAFVEAAAEQQHGLVLRHVGTPWFVALCELVAEGYYSNPGNGSNPDAISWRMVGYEPGLPEGPDGSLPNQQDMVRGKLCA